MMRIFSHGCKRGSYYINKTGHYNGALFCLAFIKQIGTADYEALKFLAANSQFSRLSMTDAT